MKVAKQVTNNICPICGEDCRDRPTFNAHIRKYHIPREAKNEEINNTNNS